MQVLEIHLAADGLVVCAPISLLPQLKVTQEVAPEQNLQKLEDMELSLENPGPKELSKNELVSSRQKLLALNHSLNSFMSFTLSDMKPSRALRPATHSEKRVTIEEDGKVLSYLWDVDSKTAEWQASQFPNFKSLVRVSALQDEGDSRAAMCMAQHGLSVNLHRDTSHKLAREECLAAGSVPDVGLIKKQVALICKFDRAPWRTSSFGRRLQEAKEMIHLVPPEHSLIQMCAAGILDDLRLDPASPLSVVKSSLEEYCKNKVSTGTEHKSSRWCDFVDAWSRLKRQWHCRLFIHLFALLLEGHNPMEALASSFQMQGSAEPEEVALQPRVLRVPRPSSVHALLQTLVRQVLKGSFWHTLFPHAAPARCQ